MGVTNRLIFSLLYPAKLQAAVVVYGPGHEGPGTGPSPKLAVVNPDFSHRFSVIEQGVWTKIRELFATAKSHPNTALQSRLKLPRPGTFELAGSALSDGSFHHQACYSHGEEFHPRLNVKGLSLSELAQLQEILSRATLIYVKQQVTTR